MEVGVLLHFAYDKVTVIHNGCCFTVYVMDEIWNQINRSHSECQEMKWCPWYKDIVINGKNK